MRSTLRTALIGSIASLAIGLTTIGLSVPASAAMRMGGGGGGFRGGGGGGFHGGFAGFRGGGLHSGFAGRHDGDGDRFRGGFARRHDGFRDRGFALGLGLGALGVAGAYGYGDPYANDDYAYNAYGYGDSGCMTVRPTYDRYGHYLGRRTVNVCQ